VALEIPLNLFTATQYDPTRTTVLARSPAELRRKPTYDIGLQQARNADC